MLSFTHSFTVDCPVEVVFRDVADFSTAQDWDPGIVSSRRLDDAEIGVGSTFEVVARFRGKDVPMTYTITEVVPNERIVVRGEAARASAVDTITFSGDDTRTTVTYDTTMSMKGLYGLAEPFLRGTFDEMGRHALEGLEKWLPGRCGGASGSA